MPILYRFHGWLIFARVIALFMFVWPYVRLHILRTQLVICLLSHLIYPCNEVVGGYSGFNMSVCPTVCRQILCRTITWVVFLRIFLKFYQLFTGEERRIPFIFDDFHFCHSRVIGLDMTEKRIFTLCRMITWVVFLRMFWNFISSLPVKRGGSLLFLVGTISNVLVMEIGSTDVGSGGIS